MYNIIMLKGICKVCEKETNFVYLYPLRKDERYKIYKCSNCDFEFLYPTPKSSEISKIYNDSNYPAYYLSKGSEKTKKKNFINILNIAKKILSKDKLNFLDIGAGAGYAMEVAQELGWNSYGIEISKTAYDILQRKFDKDKIFNCDFLDFKTDVKFDIILMSDFLEHTTNPKNVLIKSHSLLNKNGILVINTPNTLSLSAKIFRNFWFQYKLEHYFYLNQNNIKLLTNGYFDILLVKHLLKWISLDYLVNYFNFFFYKKNKNLPFSVKIIFPLLVTGEMLIILKKQYYGSYK